MSKQIATKIKPDVERLLSHEMCHFSNNCITSVFRDELRRLLKVSTSIPVTIFSVTMYWLGIFWKLFSEKAEDDEWNVTNLIGGAK
jgi:hypothetical protein